MAVKFCTLDDVRALAGLSQSDTRYSDLISSLIYQVTGQFQTFCRRKFVKAAYTEFFPTQFRDEETAYSRPQKLRVIESPIDGAAAFSLYYDEVIVDWTTNTALVEGEDYSRDNSVGGITLFIPTAKRQRAIKITYTGGYAADGTDAELILVDPVIRSACAQQVAYRLERINNKQVGVRKIVQSGREIEIHPGTAVNMLAEVTATLAPYRRILTPVG